MRHRWEVGDNIEPLMVTIRSLDGVGMVTTDSSPPSQSTLFSDLASICEWGREYRELRREFAREDRGAGRKGVCTKLIYYKIYYNEYSKLPTMFKLYLS